MNDENGQPIPLQFHLRQFRRADLFASKHSFVLDGAVEEIQCEQRASIDRLSLVWGESKFEWRSLEFVFVFFKSIAYSIVFLVFF